MRLNITGNVFSQTGYAVHTRFLAEALQDIGYDVAVESPKHQGWETMCPDKLFKMLQKQYQRETTIMIATPDYYPIKWSDNPKHLIGFVVWESDRVPKSWLKNLQLCSQIWVPSKHVYDALINTFGVDSLPPVYIVPHGVNTDEFYPVLAERDERFTFLGVKGWAEGINDRGGLQYLIKAFVDEFKEDEPVKLLVKINCAYGANEAIIEDWIRQMGIEALPSNVELIFDNIPYHELKQLYCKADVFVCSTRGEAFNLPGVEAMACGIPTMQTNFGGQLDYMHDGNSWVIRHKLKEPIHNLLFEGSNWATPDIEDLRKGLRYCFEHKQEVKDKGKIALVDSKCWTWKNSALKAKQALDLI